MNSTKTNLISTNFEHFVSNSLPRLLNSVVTCAHTKTIDCGDAEHGAVFCVECGRRAK